MKINLVFLLFIILFTQLLHAEELGLNDIIERAEMQQSKLAQEVRDAVFEAKSIYREMNKDGELKKEVIAERRVYMKRHNKRYEEYLRMNINGRELNGEEMEEELKDWRNRGPGDTKMPLTQEGKGAYDYHLIGSGSLNESQALKKLDQNDSNLAPPNTRQALEKVDENNSNLPSPNARQALEKVDENDSNLPSPNARQALEKPEQNDPDSPSASMRKPNARDVWVIGFKARQKEDGYINGKLYISKDDFNIARMEFAPAKIPRVMEDMKLALTYSEIQGYSLPVKFEMDMKIKVGFLVNLFYRHITVEDTYSEYRFNNQLTDSFFESRNTH